MPCTAVKPQAYILSTCQLKEYDTNKGIKIIEPIVALIRMHLEYLIMTKKQNTQANEEYKRNTLTKTG